MSQTMSESHRNSLQAVLEAGGKSPIAAVNGTAFLRGYFASVEPEDLSSRAPQELAAAAFAHLRFAGKRRRGRAAVRVFNPTLREHGYTSPHTIVEMVGEDMPFLVDSIGLAFQSRGLTLHFLAHPVFAVVRDAGGALRKLRARDEGGEARGARLESFQHVEIDRIVDAAALAALAAEIARN